MTRLLLRNLLYRHPAPELLRRVPANRLSGTVVAEKSIKEGGLGRSVLGERSRFKVVAGLVGRRRRRVEVGLVGRFLVVEMTVVVVVPVGLRDVPSKLILIVWPNV